MIPWETLDTVAVPGDGGEMRLMRRGHEYVIRLGPIVLMGSRTGGSEEALARLGCAGLDAAERPRVLIGGLGMGFTLRATLALLGPHAAVTVAELVPAVVAWGRGPLSAVHAGSLDDPRVTVHEGDVGAADARRVGPRALRRHPARRRQRPRRADAGRQRRALRRARAGGGAGRPAPRRGVWPCGRPSPTTASRRG